MFASDIGITAFVLSIRNLIHAHARKKARVRRIVLIWLLNTEDKGQWAEELLLELISLDQGRCTVSSTYGLDPSDSELCRFIQDDPAHIRFGGRHKLDMTAMLDIE
ncbi:MAG: hypothetical protein Q9159_006642 [Coniocarpon cinnabarinum]